MWFQKSCFGTSEVGICFSYTLSAFSDKDTTNDIKETFWDIIYINKIVKSCTNVHLDVIPHFLYCDFHLNIRDIKDN